MKDCELLFLYYSLQLISKMVKPKKENNPYYRAKHFHNSRIFAVKYHPSEIHTFLSGGWDDKVRVCNEHQRFFSQIYIRGVL